MDPFTLLTVLARAYAAYKTTSFAVESGADIIHLINGSSSAAGGFDPDHDGVPGEEQYLFVLGRITVKYALPDVFGGDGPVSEDELRELLTLSVAETLESRATPESYTTIVAFAQALGRNLEAAMPGVWEKLASVRTDAREVDLFSDPVYQYVIVQRNPANAASVTSALQLGKVDMLSEIQRAIEPGEEGTDYWGSSAGKHTAQGDLYSTNSTFFGLVVDSAIASARMPARSIRLLDGPDGMVVTPLALVTPPSQIAPRPLRPVVGSVPQALADYYASRNMRRLGYEYVPNDRQWAPATEIVNNEKGEKVIKKFDPATEIATAGVAAVKAAASKKAKEAASTVMRKLARRWLQKQTKL